MFGPNVKTDLGDLEYYHHRGRDFHALMEGLEIAFHELFGLRDFDFLFVTGSGSLVNEIVMSSFRGSWRVLFADAEFGKRLAMLEHLHRKPPIPGLVGIAYTAYETSVSRFNIRTVEQSRGLVFADMISAFPYIMPDAGVDIFTTVSSKQLGAYPVLGVIGYRRDLRLDSLFENPVRSVLNLRAHVQFREKSETLTTPAIPLYRDLLECLEDLDVGALRRRINHRWVRLRAALGPDQILGVPPVATLKYSPVVMKAVHHFGLYCSGAGPQVFLYSGADCEFERFCRYLEVSNGDGKV